VNYPELSGPGRMTRLLGPGGDQMENRGKKDTKGSGWSRRDLRILGPLKIGRRNPPSNPEVEEGQPLGADKRFVEDSAYELERKRYTAILK